MAPNRSSFYHQSGVEYSPTFLNAPRFRSENEVFAAMEAYWRPWVRRSTIDREQEIRYSYRARLKFTCLKPNPKFDSGRILRGMPSTCVERSLAASMRSSFGHQVGVVIPLLSSNALMFHSLKTKHNMQPRQEFRAENQVLASRGERSAFLIFVFLPYIQARNLSTVIERGKVLLPYNEPNMQRRHGIRIDNQALAPNGELLASKSSSPLHQSDLKHALPLSDTPRSCLLMAAPEFDPPLN